MGWCKPLGGHAYESGWSKGDCTTAKGDYLEDDPNPPPPDGGIPGADQPPKKGCFIATAAYGSSLEPEVQLLRRFKDDVLMKTRAGARFFENFYRPYQRVSPAIVEIMEQDPQIRALVRWIVVTPVVSQLPRSSFASPMPPSTASPSHGGNSSRRPGRVWRPTGDRVPGRF